MNTPEVAAELGVVDRCPTKLIIDDGRTDPNMLYGNGPFVHVVGESRSKAAAKGVVIQTQTRMRQKLVDRQEAFDALPETYLTMVDVVAPTTPKVVTTVRIKVRGIAVVLTLVVGMGIAYDWLSVRASRHRLENPSGVSLVPPLCYIATRCRTQIPSGMLRNGRS
jgi:hypothetical protein